MRLSGPKTVSEQQKMFYKSNVSELSVPKQI